MQTIRVGKEMYVIKDDRSEADLMALRAKASKVPTVKQARARALTGGCRREYPRFVEGTSVEQYVTDYYALNTEAFRGWTSASLRRGDARELVNDFFQPLSTLPMFTPDDSVVEETL